MGLESPNKINTNFLLARGFRVIVLLILTVYFFAITNGTGDLFRLTKDHNSNYYTLLNGVPYDSLGQNLLKGSSEVDPTAITYEAFYINGKYYMYFGPFPALLRIIPNMLFPELYGKWSKISCLIASLLCLIAFALIIQKHLLKNNRLSEKEKRFFFYVSLLGFGLGSPLLMLMRRSFIYHEAIVWGLCLSLCGIYFVISILYKEERTINFFAFSFCAGAALLSRVTFGISLYIMLFLLFVNLVIEYIKLHSSIIDADQKIAIFKKFLLKFFVLVCPALIALSFQLWYNYNRFGSVTTFYKVERYSIERTLRDWGVSVSSIDCERISTLFNFERIPSALFNYFGFRSEYFSTKPPFINIPNPRIKVTNPNIFFIHPDASRTISLLVASTWLVWGSAIGFYWLFAKKDAYLYKFCAIALFFNVIFILGFHQITHRYANEFLPFMVFLYSFYLLELGKHKFLSTNINYLRIFTLLLCLFSIYVSIPSYASTRW